MLKLYDVRPISLKWRLFYSVDNDLLYDHTCDNTLARTFNVMDNDGNAFSYWNKVYFEVGEIPFWSLW